MKLTYFEKVCLFFWFLILFGIGSLCLYVVGDELYTLYDLKTWTTTNAKIIESEVEAGVSKYGSWWVKIKYEFYVEGIRYIGDRYKIGGVTASSRVVIEKIIEQYPVGSTTKIYYSPANPNKNCIIPEVDSDFFLVLIMGVGCCWLFFYTYKKTKARVRDPSAERSRAWFE